MKKKEPSFIYRNSLGITFLALLLLTLYGQAITGWHEHNSDLIKEGARTLGLLEYLSSGHFLQSTFENWESEFLQMGMYVVLTVFLRQKGSAESKSLDKKEKVDREPKANADAPWSVRKGGIFLKIYQNSLALAFLILFILSFFAHAYGSWVDFNEEQLYNGEPQVKFTEYFSESRLWFESFQNWQSEFLSVLAIVWLSIFLRQKGSPESKPVDAPHDETGS